MRTVKKVLSVLLVCAMLLTAAPLGGFAGIGLPDIDFSAVFASDAKAETSGYFSYTVTDGKASITDCDPAVSGVITVPAELDGYPVTSIGNYTFYECTLLTSVIIPDSVTSIGNSVFAYCASLTSVSIPDSVTSIGYFAFRSCTSLTSVTIGEGVTSIGNASFEKCTSLTAINVNADNAAYASVDGILYNKDKTTLICYPANKPGTSFTIPAGVTSIGQYAFYGCSALTSVTIGDSVTNIEQYAFYGCSALASVTIPDSIPIIGQYTFYGCSALTSVTIPDGVTTIAQNAFYGCSELASVTIPDSVTSIGFSAFENCTSLTSVYITDLAAWCAVDFSNKTSNPLSCADNLYLNGALVTQLIIPDSITHISGYAFSGYTGLSAVTIHAGVTHVGDYAFADCINLATVSLADNIAYVGYYAFNNTALFNDETNWQDGVLYIGKYLIDAKNDLSGDCAVKDGTQHIACSAFIYTDLTSVSIPDSVTIIGYDAFNAVTSLKSVAFGNGVTEIDIGAFWGCTSLTSITLPESLTHIGRHAFRSCSSLTSVRIPAGVTTIGDCAFMYCTELTSVVFDKNSKLTFIDMDTFYGCTKLTSVTIPASVNHIGHQAFAACTALQEVHITDLAAWCNIIFDGYSANTDSNPLYYANNLYLNGTLITDLVIPDSVTSVSSSAFNNCTSISSITIPDSVTQIGIGAFLNTAYYNDEKNWSEDGILYIGKHLISRNTNAEAVTIRNGTKTIANNAFANMSALTSVTFPDSIENIGLYAFSDCYGLTSVSIPEGAKRIYPYAFWNCTSLEAISLPDSLIQIGVGAFLNTAYYNDESNRTDGNLYIGNNLIKNSKDISGTYTIKDGTKCVAAAAISNISAPATVIVPESVAAISESAFYNSSLMTAAVFRNPDCLIYDHNETIYANTVIYGYENSTAQSYAAKYDRTFVPIYDLSYNANGGSNAPAMQKGESTCNISADMPVRSFYTFRGWSLQNDATTSDYKPGDSITLNENTALYAVWSQDVLSVSSSVTAEVFAGQSYYFVFTPSEDGIYALFTTGSDDTKASLYAADGSLLASDDNGGEENNCRLQSDLKADHTYYYAVQFADADKAGSFTAEFIQLDVTPPTGAIASTNNVAQMQTVTLSLADNKGVAGYYWGTSSDYADNAYVLTDAPTEQKTVSSSGTYYLTVQDTSGNISPSYSITFHETKLDANGGTVSPASVLTANGNSFSFPLPERERHDYIGWSTSADAANGEFTLTPTKDATFYAIWVNPFNLGDESYNFPNFGDEDSEFGHCFGMSMTSAGYYSGELSKSVIGADDSESLYDLAYSATLKAPICHYQDIQGYYSLYATVAGGNYYFTQVADIESDWAAVIDYVKDHEYDHKGSLQIGFRKTEQGGHAVNFLYYKEVDGQQRIYIYDNNFPTMETYLYKAADGNIYQAPLSTFSGSIDCIALRDTAEYFSVAATFDSTRCIYAEKGAINVEGDVAAYPMECNVGGVDYIMYEFPEKTETVQIIPLEDNASFSYLNKELSFGAVGDDTMGVLKLTNKDEGSAGDAEIQFTIINEPAFRPGDVDGNGDVTATDARLALRAAVSLEVLTAAQTKAADVNHDDEITAFDARRILRASVGLETL